MRVVAVCRSRVTGWTRWALP